MTIFLTKFFRVRENSADLDVGLGLRLGFELGFVLGGVRVRDK